MYWKAENNPLGREINTLPLEELTPLYTFHPKIKQEVLDSIKERGLINPIIVVPHGILDKKPEKYTKYYVHTGNNRYWAAVQAGATQIDAYICENLKELPDLEQKMYINPRFYDGND